MIRLAIIIQIDPSPDSIIHVALNEQRRGVSHNLLKLQYITNEALPALFENVHKLMKCSFMIPQIVYKPEPIKPVEAVFLALYLTVSTNIQL